MARFPAPDVCFIISHLDISSVSFQLIFHFDVLLAHALYLLCSLPEVSTKSLRILPSDATGLVVDGREELKLLL
jgi:hypothetical protein